MIVIGGPSGGGKSTAFPAADFAAVAIPYFNLDACCQELNGGSAQRIAQEIRGEANRRLRGFCLEHIAARTSFAFETTLRHDFALSVVREAKAVGFTTDLYLVVLDSVERHVQRVTARARAGGPQRARVVAARHLHAQDRALTAGPSHFQSCDGGRQYP